MQKKVYKTTRKYKCPYCEKRYPRMELISHVDRVHGDIIPENYNSARVVYDSINKTDHGTCMICKKPVYDWNEKISRYNNLCGSEKCRAEVRRIALERHIKTYNAPTLLTNPEHQEKMLANRHISGKYKHSDGAVFTYTGKYEKAAIEFMDKVMNIPSKDIQMPGPTLEYEYNGQIHTWITDIYYIPANLIIEVKDGGNNPNKREMPEYRGKQKAKEIMITELGKFNYLRLTDNNFAQLLEALADIKYENIDQSTAPNLVYHINESDASIKEEVGGIPPAHASSTWIEPIMMDTTFTSRLAIGNDQSDDMAIIDLVSDSFELAKQEDYFKNKDKNTGEAIVHTSMDSYDVFKDSINKAKGAYELMDSIIGHRIRSIDELALMPNWRYIDYNQFYIECALISTGVVRENMIASGTIRVVDGTDVPIKKSVLLSHSDKGYFVHTPNDFYLSSNFYDSPEDIPDNVIEIMGDIYDRKHKEVASNGI